MLNDCLIEKIALDSYLHLHDKNSGQKALSFLNCSEYQALLSSTFKPLSLELQEWMQESYEKNPKYSDQLLHSSVSGNYVRSKSESMIDMLLFTNKIPFRYECALHFGNCTIYPDFTIRHPVTGEIFYWEHFRLMDDPSYRRNAFSKLQLYASHQILPGINLITTFETKEKPLTFDMIRKIIEQYFL